MKASGEQTARRFGPFVLEARVAKRRDLTLDRATFFGPGPQPCRVLLRRTRRCADGANEALLERAARYASLTHDNIARVLDFGALHGRTYVATERVWGHNLLRVLGRCGQKNVGFPTDVALYVLQCVLKSLHHAHERGVVHGDLGHGNVLIDMEGKVKVSDFDLGSVSTRRHTDRGCNVNRGRGFSCYRSPEELRGEPPSAASDLFSAAVLLFELVTGHLLFAHQDEDALIERLTGGVYGVPLEKHRPDLHPELHAMLTRALAAKPQDRFRSAADFMRAIHALVDRVEVDLDALFARRLMGQLFSARPAP